MLEPPPLLVLVVDDDPDQRGLLVDALTYVRLRAVGAADGLEAVQEARRLLPDVVLMDIHLPALDGIEATRRLKADPATRAIPIVALSAAPDDVLEAAVAAGCAAALSKPASIDAIVSVIRRVCPGRGRGVPLS